MREKQKARRIYGVLEKQFRNMYEDAGRRKGITGEILLAMLEMRLDNVVFRSRYSSSRAQARQLVRHGHILVNSKRVTIPSYRIRPGDKVSLSEAAKEMAVVRRNLELVDRTVPVWLATEGGLGDVTVLSEPKRSEIDETVREQLIVELYSK